MHKLQSVYDSLVIEHDLTKAKLAESLEELARTESTRINSELIETLQEKVSSLERRVEQAKLSREEEADRWLKQREEKELECNELVSKHSVELEKKDEELRKLKLSIADLESSASQQLAASSKELKAKEACFANERDEMKKEMEALKVEADTASNRLTEQLESIKTVNSKLEADAEGRLSALEIKYSEEIKTMREESLKLREQLLLLEAALKEKEREIDMAKQAINDLREREAQDSKSQRETTEKLEAENEQLNTASDELMISLEILDTDFKDVSRKYAEETQARESAQKQLDESNKLVLQQLDSLQELRDSILKEKQKGQFELRLLREKHDLTHQLLLEANQKLASTESDLLNARKELEEPRSESRDKDLMIEKFRADLMRVGLL